MPRQMEIALTNVNVFYKRAIHTEFSERSSADS